MNVSMFYGDRSPLNGPVNPSYEDKLYAAIRALPDATLYEGTLRDFYHLQPVIADLIDAGSARAVKDGIDPEGLVIESDTLAAEHPGAAIVVVAVKTDPGQDLAPALLTRAGKSLSRSKRTVVLSRLEKGARSSVRELVEVVSSLGGTSTVVAYSKKYEAKVSILFKVYPTVTHLEKSLTARADDFYPAAASLELYADIKELI